VIGGADKVPGSKGNPLVPKEQYHGHRERLRARFLKNGLDSFADYEAVELLLTLAIPYKDVKPVAKLAIERFASLRGVLDAPLALQRLFSRSAPIRKQRQPPLPV
jgi:DNA repair protein RadC